MSIQLGYCTNVHAGADLAQTRANLHRYALEVKRRFSPDAAMGIGLWLSASAARSLAADREALDNFRGWLGEEGLVPFTLNGFPYGDFHRDIVKHDVYRPTWLERPRVDYTLDLIDILHRILPEGMAGSISTLPLMWGFPRPNRDQLREAARHLGEAAGRLARLERETGRLIHLCLEPEPGCALQRSGDVVDFYENHLLAEADEEAARRHIRVCHDVCHAAVMFEDQAEALRRYREAGIGVGKVQVSSAVVVEFARIAPEHRFAALQQLMGFAEDRYLHQTLIRGEDDAEPHFVQDLPEALRQAETPAKLTEQWRIHFHVPVYLEQFGLLRTSQPDIPACIEAAAAEAELSHYEVETYAWSVLPEELRQEDLAAGIAEELMWFESALRHSAVG